MPTRPKSLPGIEKKGGKQPAKVQPRPTASPNAPKPPQGSGQGGKK